MSSPLLREDQESFARGMNDSTPFLRPDECLYLENVRVTPEGQVEGRLGTRRTHGTALNSGAQGYGGIQFTLADGTVQWVVFVGDKMFYSTNEGLTWTEGASGLRTDYWSLVTMRVGSTNYLLCANGSTNTYKWDGANWGTVANIPNNVKYLAVHNERLWAYVSGITLYGSKPADFETWLSPDGFVLDFHTHDGDDVITGMFSVGVLLLVFKRKSTAYTAGFGNSDIIVRTGAQGLFRDVGCSAFRTIAACGGGALMWLSERGWELWYPSQPGPSLVSAAVQRFADRVERQAILDDPGLACAVYNPVHRTYECAVPFLGTRQNAIVFCYHLPEKRNDRAQPGAVSLLRRTALTASGSADLANFRAFPVVIVGDDYAKYGVSADEAGFDTMGGPEISLVSVDEDGFETFVSLSDYGHSLYGTWDGDTPPTTNSPLPADGYEEPVSGARDAAAMFIGDVGGRPNSMIGVGFDGFVRQFETGLADDMGQTAGELLGWLVRVRIILRPFTFKRPLERKRFRLGYIYGTGTSQHVLGGAGVVADTNVTVSVDLRADAGEVLGSIAQPPASGEATRLLSSCTFGPGFSPVAPVQSTPLRLGSRGRAFICELRSSGIGWAGVRVAAFKAYGQLLDKR